MANVYIPDDSKQRLDSLKEEFDEQYEGSISRSDILVQGMDLWEDMRIDGDSNNGN